MSHSSVELRLINAWNVVSKVKLLLLWSGGSLLVLRGCLLLCHFSCIAFATGWPYVRARLGWVLGSNILDSTIVNGVEVWSLLTQIHDLLLQLLLHRLLHILLVEPLQFQRMAVKLRILCWNLGLIVLEVKRKRTEISTSLLGWCNGRLCWIYVDCIYLVDSNAIDVRREIGLLESVMDNLVNHTHFIFFTTRLKVRIALHFQSCLFKLRFLFRTITLMLFDLQILGQLLILIFPDVLYGFLVFLSDWTQRCFWTLIVSWALRELLVFHLLRVIIVRTHSGNGNDCPRLLQVSEDLMILVVRGVKVLGWRLCRHHTFILCLFLLLNTTESRSPLIILLRLVRSQQKCLKDLVLLEQLLLLLARTLLQFRYLFSLRHITFGLRVEYVVLVVTISDMSNQWTVSWEVEGSEEHGLAMPNLRCLLQIILHFLVNVIKLDHHPHFSGYWEKWDWEQD